MKWHETYKLASKYTKSTRLIEFRFKFLHIRIATNQFLRKIGIKDDLKCSFCQEEPENLRHLFWSCHKTGSFWNSVRIQLTLSNVFTDTDTMNIAVALGITPSSSENHHQINFCCLLARYYIWRCKINETTPKAEGFLQYLKSIYSIEVKTGDTPPKKWELLNTLF